MQGKDKIYTSRRLGLSVNLEISMLRLGDDSLLHHDILTAL